MLVGQTQYHKFKTHYLKPMLSINTTYPEFIKASEEISWEYYYEQDREI